MSNHTGLLARNRLLAIKWREQANLCPEPFKSAMTKAVNREDFEAAQLILQGLEDWL